MNVPIPRTKSQQRRRTRRLLIDTALSLFVSKGYEATSVQDICARASLSKGAFYHHFAGKEALLVEALEEWANPRSSEAESWRVAGEDEPTETLAVYDSDGGSGGDLSAALQIELWAQALRQEQVRHHLRQGRSRFAALLRRRLRLRLADGNASDAEALAREIVALRDGLSVQSLLLHDKGMEARLNALAATVAGRALDGGLPEPAEERGAQKRPA